MDRNGLKLILLVTLLAVGILSSAQAQQPPMGPEDGPQAFEPQMRPGGQEGPGNHRMMPMRNQQGMMGKKGPRKANPEMQKMRKKMQATQAIAEAHKELARIYEEQKKIDEAAAELKKILDLFKGIDTEMKEATDEEGRGFPLTRKVMPVYHEIARLYLKNNRLDDAEKIMLEGIAQFENDDPQAASKLILELGEIYRQNNKLDKAETLLKKVIEINKKALEE